MNSERSRPKRRRLSKIEKQERFKSGPFAQIFDQASLIEHLKTYPNVYNDKVLHFIDRQNLSQEEWSSFDEKHHIIVNTAGGPDEIWNLIPVTYAEHKELHQLRYEAYGEEGDRVASLSREEMHIYQKEQKTEASKRGHATQKEKKLGFFNSEVQAELGRRSASLGKTPKRDAAYAKQAEKSSVYVPLFQKPLKFLFEDENGNKASFESKPFQFGRTGHIKPYILEHTPKTSKYFQKIDSDSCFSTNFNKILRKLLPDWKKAKDVRNRYKGWTVEFVDFEENTT